MKEKLKLSIGKLLLLLAPKKAAKIMDNGLTIIEDGELSFSERAIRSAILEKVERNHDYATLTKLQQQFWIKKGHSFFAENEDSFEKVFLPKCSFVFDLLVEQLSNEKVQFKTLVEIGTGNGKVLNYLTSKLPQIEEFIGLDLSPEQIKINQKTYTNPKLKFTAADALEWIHSYNKDNTIFVTSGGVLEYFPEKDLLNFLKKVNSLNSIYFVANEPNGIDHDFESQAHSIPYGHERSFTHNYVKLFKTAGFQIWHHSKINADNPYFYLSFIGAKN